MRKVEEFMNRKVISLSPEETLFDAAKKLCEFKISGAPVVEKGKLVGVISISDIIKFIGIKLGKLPKIEFPGISWVLLAFIKLQKIRMDLKKELKKITGSKVREVMSKDVITASPSMSLVETAELMERYDVNRLPVVKDGKLVGIVARADLIRALIKS